MTTDKLQEAKAKAITLLNEVAAILQSSGAKIKINEMFGEIDTINGVYCGLRLTPNETSKNGSSWNHVADGKLRISYNEVGYGRTNKVLKAGTPAAEIATLAKDLADKRLAQQTAQQNHSAAATTAREIAERICTDLTGTAWRLPVGSFEASASGLTFKVGGLNEDQARALIAAAKQILGK